MKIGKRTMVTSTFYLTTINNSNLFIMNRNEIIIAFMQYMNAGSMMYWL